MKTAVFIMFLLASSLLQPYNSEAQFATEPSVCEYQGKWKDPRTVQKFLESSISKDEIRQCLYDEKTIKNHDLVFEDLVKAWKEAITLRAQDTLRQKGVDTPTTEQIEEKKKWDLPIKLHGGILYANTGTIDLAELRDPKVE